MEKVGREGGPLAAGLSGKSMRIRGVGREGVGGRVVLRVQHAGPGLVPIGQDATCVVDAVVMNATYT